MGCPVVVYSAWALTTHAKSQVVVLGVVMYVVVVRKSSRRIPGSSEASALMFIEMQRERRVVNKYFLFTLFKYFQLAKSTNVELTIQAGAQKLQIT